MLRKLNFKVIFCLFILVFPLTLSGIEIWAETKIKVAAWNIQFLGADNPLSRNPKGEGEFKAIAEILSKYDLIAITELMPNDVTNLQNGKVKLKDDADLKRILEILSKEHGREYGYLLSNEVGWVGERYQEHYVFLYYKGLVNVVPEKKTKEKKGSLYKEPTKRPPDEERYKMFMRPPFWATFRAGKFDFSVIVVHTQPDHSKRECALMGKVYEDVQRKNGKENDVLLVGDFNLEPSHQAFNDLLERKVKREDKGKDKDLSTMVALFDEKNHSSMINDGDLNDNIIFQRKYVSEYLCSGVDEFDEEDFRVMVANLRNISDHRPVWAVFRTDFMDDDGNAEDSNTSDDSASVNNSDSGAVEPDPQSSVEEIVYVTRSGTKYHNDGCSSLGQSKIEISLAKAKEKYDPCSRCNLPR